LYAETARLSIPNIAYLLRAVFKTKNHHFKIDDFLLL